MKNKDSPPKPLIWKICIAAIALILITMLLIPVSSSECRPEPSTPGEQETSELATDSNESVLTEGKTEQETNNMTDISSETDENVATENPTTEHAEKSEDPTEHEHTYNKQVSKGTCTKDEVASYLCACGNQYTETIKKAPGHNYQTKEIEPTKENEGYTEHICSVCGHSYKDNYKDKLPSHVHDYKTTKNVEATCEKDGYTIRVCSCGSTEKTVKKAAGHKMEWEKSNVPPCVATDVTGKCSVCGHEENKHIKPTSPHSFSVQSTESEDTPIEGDTPPQEEYAGGAFATCTACGETTPLQMQGTQKNHKMGPWKDYGRVFHAAACTEPGCNYMEAVKHTYGIGHKENPTCTKGTVVYWQCTACKKANVVTVKNDALGHDFKVEYTVEPIGEELGYDFVKCTRCEATDKINFKSNIEHDCEYIDDEVAATCTEAGYKTTTCTICKKTNKITTEKALGHDYQQTTIEATCQQEGGRVQCCTRCSDQYFLEYFGKLPHDYKIIDSAIATTGWAGYNKYRCTMCKDEYREELPKLKSSEFPKGYSDGTCTIIIYKEWWEHAYVYAAHITFSDYDRLWVECGNGKYNSGTEKTSSAAKRVGAVLAINGDYAVPSNGAGGYAIARRGKVCNDKKTYAEGVYNSNTGKLTFGHSGKMLSELVADGLVTDTFQFGPVFLKNGQIIGDKGSSSRAQRTFIGTNGNAGDIWLCVSDGRYNDGKSAGLNPYQCGSYLVSKGCTLGVPLDGGGSSTMYFNGSVLNAAKNGQRAVVDFVMFK